MPALQIIATTLFRQQINAGRALVIANREHLPGGVFVETRCRFTHPHRFPDTLINLRRQQVFMQFVRLAGKAEQALGQTFDGGNLVHGSTHFLVQVAHCRSHFSLTVWWPRLLTLFPLALLAQIHFPEHPKRLAALIDIRRLNEWLQNFPDLQGFPQSNLRPRHQHP